MFRFTTLRATALTLAGSALLLLSNPVFAQESPQITPQQAQMLKQMKNGFRQSMGRDPTAEEEQQFLAAMGNTQIKLLGAIAGLTSAQFDRTPAGQPNPMPAPVSAPSPAAAPSTANTPSNGALLALMQSANADGNFAIFERKSDGFSINGQPFIDPDGKILDFGADAATGLVTYLVDDGAGAALVKLYNAKAKGHPIVAGRLRANGNRSTFEGVDGQTAGGETIVPMSRGLLVTRDESIVLVDWETGVSAKSLPEGFHAAAYQNGDVAGTRNILLERTRNPSPLGGYGSLKELFGKSDASDYAFYNLDTGNLVSLQFTRGKNEATFDTPAGRITRESIREEDGRPNYSHYYWSINWTNSKHGPLAVAIEKGLQDLNLIDLQTGTKHNVVHRGAGIQRFELVQLSDGDFEIRGGWSFKDHPIRASEVLAGEKIQ
ncbi:hypothetical protein [Thermomonas brevis]